MIGATVTYILFIAASIWGTIASEENLDPDLTERFLSLLLASYSRRHNCWRWRLVSMDCAMRTSFSHLKTAILVTCVPDIRCQVVESAGAGEKFGHRTTRRPVYPTA